MIGIRRSKSWMKSSLRMKTQDSEKWRRKKRTKIKWKKRIWERKKQGRCSQKGR
jgi:hypothetical protein